jgi:hypothetical protein
MFVAVLFCLIVPRAHAARWLVPAGAHATGAQDTNWRTDLLVSNPSDEAATVTVYLLEARQDNLATAGCWWSRATDSRW